jgi:hypothetical protein
VLDQGEDDVLVSVLLEVVAGVREPQHLGIRECVQPELPSTFKREGDVLQRPRYAGDAADSGTLSLEHLRENQVAAEIELTDDEFEALR